MWVICGKIETKCLYIQKIFKTRCYGYSLRRNIFTKKTLQDTGKYSVVFCLLMIPSHILRKQINLASRNI